MTLPGTCVHIAHFCWKRHILLIYRAASVLKEVKIVQCLHSCADLKCSLAGSAIGAIGGLSTRQAPILHLQHPLSNKYITTPLPSCIQASSNPHKCDNIGCLGSFTSSVASSDSKFSTSSLSPNILCYASKRVRSGTALTKIIQLFVSFYLDLALKNTKGCRGGKWGKQQQKMPL